MQNFLSSNLDMFTHANKLISVKASRLKEEKQKNVKRQNRKRRKVQQNVRSSIDRRSNNRVIHDKLSPHLLTYAATVKYHQICQSVIVSFSIS